MLYFYYFIWTAFEYENADHIATPEELGQPASAQIARGRNRSPNGLPSRSTAVNGKPRRVLEDGESWTEYSEKFAVPDASSEREVAGLEHLRLVELERQQLSARPAVQTEQDLAQPKSTLLEQAEVNAAQATKRAGLEPREQGDRLLAQTSLVEQKDAELVKMQAKLDALDELLLSRDQQVRALSAALEHQAEQYKTELAQVRAKLEAKQSESEAVCFQFVDGKNEWAKSKIETDTLPMAGLVSLDEARITHGLVERIQAMEAEMASLRGEKSSEAIPTRNEG